MSISRENLCRLKEAPLRTDVLIPLLKAMGFQDVFHHHGGPHEQGKDIVMWKPGELGERVNYAVVAKAGDINGRAQGVGSAGEVAIQVQQCFGAAFRDSLTAEDQQVDQCWVIASGTMTTATIQSLRSALGSQGLVRATKFINGDKLWDLLSRFLPEKTAWAQFGQAHKTLQELVPGYELSLTTNGQTTEISLNANENATGIEPLEIAFHLNFPPTEQGSVAFEEYRQFVRTGSAFKLPPEVISRTDLPQPLQRLYDFSDTAKLGFSFTPISPDLPYNAIRLERICTDGTRAALENLEMAYVQGGTEEFTLSNKQQKLPWIISFKIDHRTGTSQFACKTNLEGSNCKQASEWLRFAQALSKPGAFKVYSHVTGFDSASSPEDFPPLLSVEEAPSAEFVELVDKLVVIQRRSQKVLWLPKQISAEEWSEIETVYSAVTTGKVVLPPDSLLFAGSIKKGALRKIWQRFLEPGTFVMKSKNEQTRKILGVEIPMGPVVIRCVNAVLVEPDVRAMFGKAKGTSRHDDKRRVKTAFRAVQPGARLWMEYPRWAAEGVFQNS